MGVRTLWVTIIELKRKYALAQLRLRRCCNEMALARRLDVSVTLISKYSGAK
jgi:hypothetical protein